MLGLKLVKQSFLKDVTPQKAEQLRFIRGARKQKLK